MKISKKENSEVQLTRVPRMQEVESSNPKSRPNFTQRCKRFVTASTSTKVALIPRRYDAEMGTANSLHASALLGEYNKRLRFGFWKTGYIS